MTSKTLLANLRNFFRRQISGGVRVTAFAEQLADDVFHRHFLHVDVAYIAGIKELPAGFGDSRARNF